MTFSPFTFVPSRRGDKGEHVARLQGWLHLHGYDPGPVDGDFGPRTEHAIQCFESFMCLGDHGPEETWKCLTAPLARATAPLEKWRPPSGALGQTLENMPRTPSLGQAVAACARQWLAQSVGGGPLRELPGNSGPVVEACTRRLAEDQRLPCECGHKFHGIDSACPVSTFDCAGCGCQSSRPNWRLPWCAGWVSAVLRQACESLGVDMPIAGSLNCDVLAHQAERESVREGAKCVLVAGTDAHKYPVRPGDLFLVREPGGWKHCGVVLEVMQGEAPVTLDGKPIIRHAIRTAEGNTNKDGSRNGTELRERIRSASEVDYICWRKS